MAGDETKANRLEHLLETPNLADALESDRFKQFLDQVPVAIAVAELSPQERIVYANHEFERLTGQASADLVGCDWSLLAATTTAPGDGRSLATAITQDNDYIGVFEHARADGACRVDAWSNLIEDDAGSPTFRLVALVESAHATAAGELAQQIEEKDLQLRELQHRVKNNLQMITALIRVEARAVTGGEVGDRFVRLAGRIEALGLLYRSLTEAQGDAIDLGVYLSEIASAVMRAHAVEGIRLDLKVDTWPVSLDVAMPAGLVVNELLTNALKHAFGPEGGVITLHSLAGARGCKVVVADDGMGLPEGVAWPRRGKLSALIVQSLRQNAKADITVESEPGRGMRVSIFFARADAAPTAADEAATSAPAPA
jgi:PAS domain S-box-containing protein